MTKRGVIRGPRALGVLAVVVSAIGLAGCLRPHCPPPTLPATKANLERSIAGTGDLTPEQRVAVDWIRRARAAEVGVTPRLLEIAEAGGGRLVGLEHKIKSLRSTVSKLERFRAKDTDTPLEEFEVYDALRYTMLVPDEPAGHHDATIREALASLERDGFGIRKVKNYWPRGDSYSGTNCTLETPGGLPWELQFHTPRSYEAKSSVHDDYDRMRDASTQIEERRRLFEKMKEMWETIPIPEGILVPGSLHANEEMRLLPAP